MRSGLFALALLCLSTAFAQATPTISAVELPSPTGLGALAPSLTVGPDGAVWLSWVEAGARGPAAAGAHAHGGAAISADARTLALAALGPTEERWGAPHTVAHAPSITASQADFPQLAVDGTGRLAALWTDGHGGALLSLSSDAGQTWTNPSPWTRASASVEKFSLVRLDTGRVLVAWLDGRNQPKTHRQQLFARLLGDPDSADMLVDSSVCDCCQTALTAFPDGTALAAYRGRTDDEVRDIMTARYRGRAWDSPRRLSADDWRINACPMNGPRVASWAGNVAAAWFTGAGGEPRVLASFSPDAGARWLEPLRLDRGHPVGHVDTVILRDGALVVTWLESDGSLWLRRISPDFSATEPVALAPAGAVATRSVPRAALRRDYTGERSSAELVVAYTRAGASAGVATLRVTVPEGELLAAERSCGCSPSPEELQAVPVRGRIVSLDPATNTAQVAHGEVPGVFAPGTTAFTLSPELVAQARTGAEFLGRVDRNAGTWRLIELRWLAAR